MADAIALVTGAASGIGAATVEAALESGFRVIALDVDRDAVAGRWPESATVKPVVGDVRVADDVRSAMHAMTTAPSLVVNCAGIGRRALIEDLTDEDWQAVLAVNLTGTMVVCREALLSLEPGSTVINIASIAGHRSFAGRAAYCASKAGVVAFTEVLALEGAGKGVRALAVSPGYVRTPMAAAQDGFVDEDLILSRVPVGRLAEPNEIGQAIVALAGSQFSFLTGSTVIIDGGWCANGGFWPVPALETKHRNREHKP